MGYAVEQTRTEQLRECNMGHAKGQQDRGKEHGARNKEYVNVKRMDGSTE
jgi:hypothetical protein